MSRSIRSVISQKATNKIVQLNNNLVEFVKPVIYHGDLFVRRNFGVYGNANVVGDITVGGDEKVSGDVTVGGDEKVSGDVTVDGTILAKTFLPGQVINVSMLSYTDLAQNSDVIIAATATTNIFTFTYTPKYSTSYLIIEYQSTYSLGGSGDDQSYAFLKVNGDRISQSYQRWVNALGGGGRSGALFPLIGRYTNTNTSSKVIAVDLLNSTIGDPITVKSDISTWLKITEIGR
jgi:hypothetical protein